MSWRKATYPQRTTLPSKGSSPRTVVLPRMATLLLLALQHGDKFANSSGVAKHRESSKFAAGRKFAMECNWQRNQGL
jgi:hypothetical protein